MRPEAVHSQQAVPVPGLLRSVFGRGGLQELALAALAVAVIALMVLPLPPVVLDALIAVNIGLSVLLLMLSMYVPSLLGLSTFPTLLLFTTLLRLSLNIATTRAILLHADAGQIIQTFGQLVVGGNLIVGVVVFLIIAIVQFIVIAKGAERVAEVGARFTLDALPGKQMSIDAELRAGLIDKEESRAKREQLQQESQLFGAMDGAMKFVKGDAIAGLLIALVNIVAGVSIGVAMKDMSFAQASSTYAILTVGDGLVSQIPSLFVSLAAGILITSVGGTRQPNAGLGGQIGAQLMSQPKALMLTAGVLGMFMLVPGFPRLQFLFWAAVLAAGGWWLWKRSKREAVFETMAGVAFHRDGIGRPRLASEIADEVVSTYSLELRLSPTLAQWVMSGTLDEEVASVRHEVTQRLGIAFPGIAVLMDGQQADDSYQLSVFGVPVAVGNAARSSSAKSVQGTVNPNDKPEQDSGAVQVIGQVIAQALRKHASDFIGLQETTFLLGETEKAYPDLVAEVQRAVPVMRLTDVLKRLVQEGISLRNLRDILQAVLEWSAKEKDVVLLTEHVRNSLARQITYQYGGLNKQLHGVLLDRAAEEAIRSAVRATPAGNYLALDPAVAASLTRRIGDLAQSSRRPADSIAVVVVSMDIRRYVRMMIELDLPDLPVVSYQDLTGDAKVQPLGRCDLEPAVSVQPPAAKLPGDPSAALGAVSGEAS